MIPVPMSIMAPAPTVSINVKEELGDMVVIVLLQLKNLITLNYFKCLKEH